VQYFLKLSGIPDEKGRAGHYPGRLEAEDARLTGYQAIDIIPWEDASGGKAIACKGQPSCTAEWSWSGAAGRYNIAVQYFDLQGGASRFSLLVKDRPVDRWLADSMLPSQRPNGDNSTRRTVSNIDLKPGDTIRIVGVPDRADPATLDYVEITPATNLH
jgi:alpha-glucuronidase